MARLKVSEFHKSADISNIKINLTQEARLCEYPNCETFIVVNKKNKTRKYCSKCRKIRNGNRDLRSHYIFSTINSFDLEAKLTTTKGRNYGFKYSTIDFKKSAFDKVTNIDFLISQLEKHKYSIEEDIRKLEEKKGVSATAGFSQISEELGGTN